MLIINDNMSKVVMTHDKSCHDMLTTLMSWCQTCWSSFADMTKSWCHVCKHRKCFFYFFFIFFYVFFVLTWSGGSQEGCFRLEAFRTAILLAKVGFKQPLIRRHPPGQGFDKMYINISCSTAWNVHVQILLCIIRHIYILTS